MFAIPIKSIRVESKVRLFLTALFALLCVLETLDGLGDVTDLICFILLILSVNHLMNGKKKCEVSRGRGLALKVFTNFILFLLFIVGTFIDIVPFDPIAMSGIKVCVTAWSLTFLCVSLKEVKKGRGLIRLVHANLALMIMIGSLYYF